MSEIELVEWAAQQSIAFEVVSGRVVRSAEEGQAPFRLAALRQMAEGVFGPGDQAAVWLATPSAELGGVSPADLANENEDGHQLALRTLICWHRMNMEQGNG